MCQMSDQQPPAPPGVIAVAATLRSGTPGRAGGYRHCNSRRPPIKASGALSCNPQSEIRNHYGSNRFCAIHCGTVCGCFRSLSFSPNVRFQNDGLSFCAMRDDGLLGCFVLPGVRADTVLCHALFVPLATLFAPSFIV